MAQKDFRNPWPGIIAAIIAALVIVYSLGRLGGHVLFCLEQALR